MKATTSGARLIVDERVRQQLNEGFTVEADQQYTNRQLAVAAGCYLADPADGRVRLRGHLPHAWPWPIGWWKPGTYKQNLVKAGALIAAELDRLLALEDSNTATQQLAHEPVVGQVDTLPGQVPTGTMPGTIAATTESGTVAATTEPGVIAATTEEAKPSAPATGKAGSKAAK